MAIMNGLTPVRGRLGGTGFRQQTVRTGRSGSGTYRRRTVAFQIQETVANPNTRGQQRQRGAFALIVALGSALNSTGILPNYYPSGTGLGNFQKFVSDNVLTIANGGAIVQNPDDAGDNYVDFRQLKVTRGSVTIPTEVFSAPELDDDCQCGRKIAWSFDGTQGWPSPQNWKLVLVGIKLDNTGAIEDVVQSQACASLDQCLATVTLPKCDCCKTYWYAFFTDLSTGYNTASTYLGTCDTVVPVYDPLTSCATCITVAGRNSDFLPPSDDPINCGDEVYDMTKVFFNGNSRFQATPGPSFTPVNVCPDCPDYKVSLEQITVQDIFYLDVDVNVGGDDNVYTFTGIPSLTIPATGLSIDAVKDLFVAHFAGTGYWVQTVSLAAPGVYTVIVWCELDSAITYNAVAITREFTDQTGIIPSLSNGDTLVNILITDIESDPSVELYNGSYANLPGVIQSSAETVSVVLESAVEGCGRTLEFQYVSGRGQRSGYIITTDIMAT